MNNKVYKCICGFETSELKEFRKHIFAQSKKEHGKHKSAKTKVVQEVKPVEIVNTEPVKVVQDKPVKEKHNVDAKRILCLIGAIITMPVAIYMITIYMKDIHNMMAALVSIVFFILSVSLAWLGFRKGESGGIVSQRVASRAPKNVVNTLLIERDTVSFCQIDENIQYHPRRCRNDSKFYNVLIKKSENLERLILPDTIYRNPTEVANYINIPAHRDLFKQEQSLFQKIAPGFLVLSLVVMSILWIATMPAPGTGV